MKNIATIALIFGLSSIEASQIQRRYPHNQISQSQAEGAALIRSRQNNRMALQKLQSIEHQSFGEDPASGENSANESSGSDSDSSDEEAAGPDARKIEQ